MKATIGFKMSVGLLVMLLLMIVPGAAGFIGVRTMHGLTSTLADKHDEGRAIWTIKVAAIKTSAALENAVEIGTEGTIAMAYFWHSELEGRTERYKSMSAGSKAELAQRLETSHLEFNDLYEEYRDKLQAREPINQEESKERMDEAVANYATALDALQNEVDKGMKLTLEEAEHIQTRILFLMVGFTATAAILGAALAWWLIRSVTRPVRRLAEAAEKVSMGDLDVEISIDSQDEIGDLAAAFERMVAAVRFFAAEDKTEEA